MAIHVGIAALAIESTVDRTLPGVVMSYDTRRRQQLGTPVTVGVLPDIQIFTPDGRKLLVANAATPNARPTPDGQSADDPVGSISIIDVQMKSSASLYHRAKYLQVAVLGLGGVGLPMLPGQVRWERFAILGTLIAGALARVQWVYYKKHM
jgi:hypothetical protein